MRSSYLSKIYSKILFEIAQQNNCLEKISQEYLDFLQIIEKNIDLKNILKLPQTSEIEKIISDLLKHYFSNIFMNFLMLIIKNKRIALLNQIYDGYQLLYQQSKNHIRAEAITAIPLADDELSRISDRISEYYKASVTLENKVDPAIIGGIVIDIDGKTFDASIREQFRKLKHELYKLET